MFARLGGSSRHLGRLGASAVAALAAFLFVLSPVRGQGWLDVRPMAVATPPPVQPDRRMIMAYYFYWYDAQTGGHLDEAGGLRHHLPAAPPPDWRSVEWHKRQLADMAYAGVDAVLAVYWGTENAWDEWSPNGLPVLARAGQALEADGIEAPKIGLFLDTSIVGMRDLTTPVGKEWFYTQFKDFFARVPRAQWAVIQGRPVAFLFTSDYTAAMDQGTFDHVYARFEAEFGVRPYIVREVSWDYPILRWEGDERVRDYSRSIRTENSYLWNAAVHGYVDAGGVAAVGPGFDDRLVPGRGGTVRDRQDGFWYQMNFWAAIASEKPLLAIETWNEVHEGSGISETVEFGRRYLDLTRPMAQAFKAVGAPPVTATATASPTMAATASPTASATATSVQTGTATSTPTSTPTRTPTSTPRAPTPTAPVPSPTPIGNPLACSPRPNVQVSVARLSPGTFRATLRSATSSALPTNALERISLGTIANGSVDLPDGTVESTGNVARLLPAGTTHTTLVLRRTSPTTPVTVRVTVTDACGTWDTLVGAGTGAQ